jgi:hypothetical protein
MTRTATCSCGQLTVTVTGDPVRVSMCHCHACQRRTGSVFAVQARFRPTDVVESGDAREWSRIGDDGGHISFRFCPTCGATVSYTIAEMPDLVAIPVGAFADATLPAPTYSVYEVRKHPWVALPESITEHVD